MFTSDPIDLIAEASDILPFTDRFRINRIINIWQTLFRDLILLTGGQQNRLLINVDFAAELEKIAARDLPQGKLLEIPAHLGSVTQDIDLNVDTRSAVGALLIDLHRMLNIR